ncbi:DegT/DnrJ/EryC1/StrS family aminotransferase [uncultured Methanobrevibacter sp.]|uniref:DegT/DnrJ/EryC1/StrS family aminotransferase n=1 Tax=uncultured Methanobrevibacter sp. TaxID=253161 RepID=UPI0026259231
MADIKVSIASPVIENEEINAVIEVMKSGMIAQGPKVIEFEKEFADFVGAKYGIATNSGTSALHVALLAAGIGEGDEVITSPFTFAATGNSILYTGARPVFVDIDEETFTLDPSKIEEAITDKTKAILPVQLYGQSADMDPIMEIAKKHDLVVIEDAAQAHGAEYNGVKVGNLGDMACFSFYPTKNMTTSEGGMITTNNEEFAENARVYRAHGSKTKYHHEVLGYNFRMTDIGAAIGLEQLKKIDSFNDKRIENAKYLNEKLADVELIETPVVKDGYKHVYHQYTIKVKNGKRDELSEFLLENGIGNGIYYPIPLYNQVLYTEMGYDQSLPVTDEIVEEVLSLPIHAKLTKEDLDLIVEVIKKADEELN